MLGLVVVGRLYLTRSLLCDCMSTKQYLLITLLDTATSPFSKCLHCYEILHM